MTDGTWCAKCRGPVAGYDTYCENCADTSEETVMTDNMLPIAFEPEHIGAICRAFDINWESQYGMKTASFADDIVERIEDLQRYVKEMERPWISVEERLPEHDQTCICRGPGGVDIDVWCQNSIIHGEWFTNTDMTFTHWMPIPPLEGK